MLAVGIGCFWFARRISKQESDDENFTPSDHLIDIEAALEGIENVSNVEINGDGDTVSLIGLGDQTEDENYFPIYSGVSIRFDIFMPKRVQEKYLLGRRSGDVETFHVNLVYDGVMPVAYIYYAVKGGPDDTRSYSPSSAVVFIRKFLEERLRGHEAVDFQTLGPSPFHADIFVEVDKSQKPVEGPADLTLVGDGYRTIYIPSVAAKLDDQADEFISAYHRILSAFYSLVRMRNESRGLRAAVTSGATELLEPPKHSRMWPRFRYWRQFGRKIDDVFQNLLEEKQDRVRFDSFIRELKDGDDIRQDNIFYRFIERETRRSRELPDEDIREVLLMLEERRRGYFQNAATLISGLVGGILGAVLGAALTFALTSGFATIDTNAKNGQPAAVSSSKSK